MQVAHRSFGSGFCVITIAGEHALESRCQPEKKRAVGALLRSSEGGGDDVLPESRQPASLGGQYGDWTVRAALDHWREKGSDAAHAIRQGTVGRLDLYAHSLIKVPSLLLPHGHGCSSSFNSAWTSVETILIHRRGRSPCAYMPSMHASGGYRPRDVSRTGVERSFFICSYTSRHPDTRETNGQSSVQSASNSAESSIELVGRF